MAYHQLLFAPIPKTIRIGVTVRCVRATKGKNVQKRRCLGDSCLSLIANARSEVNNSNQLVTMYYGHNAASYIVDRRTSSWISYN